MQWFDTHCEHIRKQYFKIKNQIIKQKKKLSNVPVSLINSFKSTSKEYKKCISKTKKNYKYTFSNKIRHLKTNDTKQYWTILNGKRKTNSCPIPLANMHDFYKEINDTNVTFTPTPTLSTQNVSDTPILDIPFTIDELRRETKKLKNGKSPGLDNVINEFIKYSKCEVFIVLKNLFNVLLKTGLIPSIWCKGIICPIYKKKGSSKEPSNYRGITLLSCICKIFTSCINTRLSLFLTWNKSIGEEQAGFRADHSTIDHIFLLHSVLEMYIENHKRIYCAFIDYKQAFDYIDRIALWGKILQVGLNGKLINIIHNIYNNAKSCVRLEGKLSSFFPCKVGVRQGDSLSPCLFAIYLADFKAHISRHYNGLSEFPEVYISKLNRNDLNMYLHLYVLLYADDTVILAESASQLQLALNSLADYCEKWHLSVNTTKTKIIIFSRGKVRKYPIFTINSSEIDVVQDYVYLGVTFNYNNKFNKHFSAQIIKAKRAMFGLLTKARRLLLPIDVVCDFFDKTIIPILLYGCEVTGIFDTEELEIFYREFLKIVLKLSSSISNAMVYGEVGRLPLQHLIEQKIISFWLKLVCNDSDKLSNSMYRILYQLHEENVYTSNWIQNIKSILDNNGLSYIWTYQNNITNRNATFNLIKQQHRDISLHKWYNEVCSKSTCTDYKHYKNNLYFEKYLTLLNDYERINLCKFRCRDNKLPISIAKYDNRVSIQCNLCKSVGDEFHYILVCPIFLKERHKYVKSIYYTSPDIYKYRLLLNSIDQCELSKLSKFCEIIMHSLSVSKKKVKCKTR